MRWRDLNPRFLREHLWTRAHVAAYAELGPPERERLERHARRCPQCHRVLATLLQVLRGLAGLREAPLAPAPAPIADAVIARLREEPR